MFDKLVMLVLNYNYATNYCLFITDYGGTQQQCKIPVVCVCVFVCGKLLDFFQN